MVGKTYGLNLSTDYLVVGVEDTWLSDGGLKQKALSYLH